MASPITWRNINAPNFSDSNRLAVQSGEQIGRGLDLLSKATAGYRQGELDTQKQQRDFQTQELLNRVNGFNDLNSYDAFQRQISSELSGLNPSQVNHSEVMSALQGRDNTLREDITQRNAFNDAPLLSQIEARTLRGDVDGANALMEQLSPSSQGKGQSFISTEVKRQDLQRQNNLVNSALPTFLANNAGNKKEAIGLVPKWLEENKITDPNIIAAIDGGKMFTDTTSTTKRQDANTLADLNRLDAAQEATLAEMDATHKGSLTLKPGEYDEFMSVSEFEGTDGDFFKRNYHGTFDSEGTPLSNGIRNASWKFFFHDNEEDVKKAEDLVQKTILGDTTPSNASDTHIALREAAKEYKDKYGVLPKNVLKAARRYSLLESMGAKSGDLNLESYNAIYEENLLRSILMEMNHRADTDKTNVYNAERSRTMSKHADEKQSFQKQRNNQNISILQSAGGT